MTQVDVTEFSADFADPAGALSAIAPIPALENPRNSRPLRTAQQPTLEVPSRLNDFYELTKPRMNFLVVVTTLVGYYMACGETVGWMRLLHTLIGTALTAAASGTLNQYLERKYDRLMPRTANRPLPAGRIAPLAALIYGVVLAAIGLSYLCLLVNPLTALLGALTLASYLFLYTPLKRVTTLCTIIGAIPGALPPVMGWTAVNNALGPEALVLFGILFLWQMPHFLAIAILYKDDYAAGGFKMLPVIDQNLASTSRQIIVYAMSLLPMSLMPIGLHMVGMTYFTGAAILGLAFLGFSAACALSRTRANARRLFLASIVYLPLLLGLLMFDRS